MFAPKRTSTVIAQGLRIIGSVSSDGAVQVNGQIDGDLNCTSLTVSPKALINGGVKARNVVVNGRVEGPIVGQDVVLKSRAFVTGDIQAQTLSIEPGAHFEGRALRELLGGSLVRLIPTAKNQWTLEIPLVGLVPIEDPSMLTNVMLRLLRRICVGADW